MSIKVKNFNWNSELHPLIDVPKLIPSEPSSTQILNTTIVSEDLRDGLHGSDRYPSFQEIIPYIHALSSVGINRMTVGIYPGESKRVDSTIKKILAYLYQGLPDITPIVLCLATAESLEWTLRCKEINPKLEAIVFMGSSPVRRLIQNWSMDFILNQMATIIKQATIEGITVIGGTEHTTQTPPEDLKKIIKTQIDSGASSFCIADTVGVSRPVGAFRITKFVKNYLNNYGYSNIPIEWHGHRDLGNDLQNAFMSICAGATRIHTVARGIGERAGNTSLESILLNFHAILRDANQILPWNVDDLLNTLKMYENLVRVNSPDHGPLGKRHSRTTLGIHADAMEKLHELADTAKKNGDIELSREYSEMVKTIYSSVDTTQFGGRPESGIGPWSSKKNVYLTLRLMGETADNTTVKILLQKARLNGRELRTKEIINIITNARHSKKE